MLNVTAEILQLRTTKTISLPQMVEIRDLFLIKSFEQSEREEVQTELSNSISLTKKVKGKQIHTIVNTRIAACTT